MAQPNKGINVIPNAKTFAALINNNALVEFIKETQLGLLGLC